MLFTEKQRWERKRECDRAYRLRNREKSLVYLREWKLRNKDYPLEYYHRNKDRILELYRKRRLHKLETDPEFVERERRSGRKAFARQKEVNFEKVKARDVANKAVKAGLLVRPEACSICGQVPFPRRDGRSQIHAHHHDYLEPLDITWVCCRCHALDHRRAGYVESAVELEETPD